MTEVRHGRSIRIALIGKTGAGKSALGNTLLGRYAFKSMLCSESVTTASEIAFGEIAPGKTIQIVDTPGIMDTESRDTVPEVTRSIAYLSPGPHAFLLVLKPNRATKEEINALNELQNLFGNETFYKNTIIIMVHKIDIVNQDKKYIDIHKFIAERTCREVQDLYEKCGRRIIAVDNKDTDENKHIYRKQIIDLIMTFSGYYSHDYFNMVIENKELRELIDEMKEKRTEQNKDHILKLQEEIMSLEVKIKKMNKKKCVIS